MIVVLCCVEMFHCLTNNGVRIGFLKVASCCAWPVINKRCVCWMRACLAAPYVADRKLSGQISCLVYEFMYMIVDGGAVRIVIVR